MNHIIRGVFACIVILFLSLYFSKFNLDYYENKKVLTQEAIEEYEKDLKEGKDILSTQYLEEEKNYNNKISKMGMKTSQFIEKVFQKGLHLIMKYLNQLQNE